MKGEWHMTRLLLAALGALVRREIERCGKLIREAGIKAN
jgi:hypothetical protein